MHFDHIETTHKYLPHIISIIRDGIERKRSALKRNSREGVNTQLLVEVFNIIGTNNLLDKPWIGIQKEHERKNGSGKEDIYFHLNDDNHTRIFYMESKRLPKYRTKDKDEYVIGELKKQSGGIQRYKVLIHGTSKLKYNGMIAFVENQNVSDWVSLINDKLKKSYPNDSLLISNGFQNEFISTHNYENNSGEIFTMHHFWINLT